MGLFCHSYGFKYSPLEYIHSKGDETLGYKHKPSKIKMYLKYNLHKDKYPLLG